MTKVELVVFTWQKQDLFCEGCGRAIGRWAKNHSGKCQSCNLTTRMKKQNLKRQTDLVSQ